ncbi:hypothetical protein LRP67_05380 [Nocardioides sp. cx-169]|uniref:hypothetical protein n=1 Tax=Nocardioides sp. cx-169 TaxID=2899080 RepID=UPI001E3865A3|nr:hypothetical protein [Nocardioides sp. cx-169]MCD4533509.1 hypothetical protein [Nocardioides sp. cx-169]
MSTYGPPEGTPPEPPERPPGPPPAQPPGGYGAPALGASGWDVGSALRYGWEKFRANVGAVIVAAIAIVVAVGVVQGAGYLVRDAMGCRGTSYEDCGGYVSLASLVSLLFSALSFVVAQIISAGVIRGGLDLTEGRRFTPATVISPHHLPQVVVASILIGVLTTVGLLLCLLPGIVFSFASQYTLYFIVDKGMGPWQAIKASIHLVRTNLADTLVWYIVGGVVAFLGFLVCLVGAIVSVPVVLIGTAYTYKVLTRQPVAP